MVEACDAVEAGDIDTVEAGDAVEAGDMVGVIW